MVPEVSRKYKGKFVVFHKPSGPGGEVPTEKLSEIDKLLAGIFTKRVAENETPVKWQPVAKSA